MEFEIRKNVMLDPVARQTFDALARQVFGLSFEGWYQSGYWTESNLPYTLLSQETALANVSVNRLEVLLDGKRRRYIQLGTVATRPDCRRQGSKSVSWRRCSGTGQTGVTACFFCQ